MAGYLNIAEYTVPAGFGECVVGFVISCFAFAGEKPERWSDREWPIVLPRILDYNYAFQSERLRLTDTEQYRAVF